MTAQPVGSNKSINQKDRQLHHHCSTEYNQLCSFVTERDGVPTLISLAATSLREQLTNSIYALQQQALTKTAKV
jgi:hypothetical protein